MKGLHDYYMQQGFVPTFADFRSDSELAAYSAMRASVMRDRLRLPPRIFNGADVLEFGPDTGENALVFAEWGAQLTLVEPNEAAHGYIRDYFERFGRSPALKALHAEELLAYRDPARYDFIIAEGFMYAIKPTRAWLDAFRRLLRDDGMFIISFYERHGAMYELALKALHAMHRRRTGLDAQAAAHQLYDDKWDSIPHTRPFSSWVMDVLEQPFVRRAYFIDAAEFVTESLAAGFDMYSAHPRYDDVLGVDWHKRVVPSEVRAERSRVHIAKSVLSFLTGRTLYIGERERAREVTALADRLTAAIDSLVDADDAVAIRTAAGSLEGLAEFTKASWVTGEAADRTLAAETFASFAAAFRLAAEPGEGLIRHTSTDPRFIAEWGIPNHFAVGRALADEPPDLK